jgi:hypothetical protein
VNFWEISWWRRRGSHRRLVGEDDRSGAPASVLMLGFGWVCAMWCTAWRSDWRRVFWPRPCVHWLLTGEGESISETVCFTGLNVDCWFQMRARSCGQCFFLINSNISFPSIFYFIFQLFWSFCLIHKKSKNCPIESQFFFIVLYLCLLFYGVKFKNFWCLDFYVGIFESILCQIDLVHSMHREILNFEPFDPLFCIHDIHTWHELLVTGLDFFSHVIIIFDT